MKGTGIINGELARALATLRHTDLFVIADAGFPDGPRETVIDLAVVPNIPRLGQVLEAVLNEVTVEAAWVASEVDEINSNQAKLIDTLIRPARIPHSELKLLAAGAKFVVRTGDATPYSNVVLQAGYPFWS